MIVHDVIQGSEDWLRLRRGVPTASQFHQVITPSGKPSKSAERYVHTLIAERLIGRSIVDHVSWYMERGSRLEADAISFFEFQTDLETTPIGFVTTDDGRIGASPDRLVGETSILEIKCPAPHTHVSYLLQDGSAYSEHRIQIMGQLWVTGRESAWLLSYNPEMPPALQYVERDEPFIRMLSDAVTTFSLELERQFQICVSRGWCDADWRRESPRRSPTTSAEDYGQRDLIGALKDSLRELKVQT